jgi:hypothetical protein
MAGGQRRNPLLARSHRPPEDGRSVRQRRDPPTPIEGPQQQPVRLRPDHARDAAQRLDARRRHREIPRTIGRQHRSRPRKLAHQRQRTVQRPQHRIHDQHTSGSLHHDSRTKIQVQDDQLVRFGVSRAAHHPRTQPDPDRHRRRAGASGASQHDHLVFR